MNNRRRTDPYYLDCSPATLSLNAWNNTTQFWSKDQNEDVTKWPLQKVFRALCSLSHHFVNSNDKNPAVMLFDSYIFDRLAERWTSVEVGGSIRIVNNRVSIGVNGVHDKDFLKWVSDHEAKKKQRQLQQAGFNHR